MKLKRYYVMKRRNACQVAKYPSEKFWGDWNIIAGPIPKKKAYTLMFREREKVSS